MKPEKVQHWTYWLVTAVATAIIGGFLLPALKEWDPLKVGTAVRTATGD